MARYKRDVTDVMSALLKVGEYNPETGIFICTATSKGRAVPIGGELGHISNSNGYKYICLEGIRYSCHALAWAWMTGDWNGGVIDHINRDRKDNRWSNLRQVTQVENQLNRKNAGGVGYHKASGKWRAYLTKRGKALHLGLFSTKEQAQVVHDKAHKAYTQSLNI